VKALKRVRKINAEAQLHKRKDCGQTTLSDASRLVTAAPVITQRFQGFTAPLNTIASSWNYFEPAAAEARGFLGRYIRRTGLIMDLVIKRTAAEANAENTEIAVFLVRQRGPVTAADSFWPTFYGRVMKEFRDRHTIVWKRRIKLGKGFYPNGIETHTFFRMKVKMNDRLDFKIPTETNVWTVQNIPDSNIGTLQLYAVSPGAPVTGTINLLIKDWKLWYLDGPE